MLAISSELRSIGLVQKEALKFAKVAVDEFGAGCLRDAISMKNFEAAITKAKLLDVSIEKLREAKASTVKKVSIEKVDSSPSKTDIYSVPFPSYT